MLLFLISKDPIKTWLIFQSISVTFTHGLCTDLFDYVFFPSLYYTTFTPLCFFPANSNLIFEASNQLANSTAMCPNLLSIWLKECYCLCDRPQFLSLIPLTLTLQWQDLCRHYLLPRFVGWRPCQAPLYMYSSLPSVIMELKGHIQHLDGFWKKAKWQLLGFLLWTQFHCIFLNSVNEKVEYNSTVYS